MKAEILVLVLAGLDGTVLPTVPPPSGAHLASFRAGPPFKTQLNGEEERCVGEGGNPPSKILIVDIDTSDSAVGHEDKFADTSDSKDDGSKRSLSR